MAGRKQKAKSDPTVELLKDLLITQLCTVGVLPHDIRKIVGCDMNRVTRIVKPIKKALKAQSKLN
jgi:hypothetical protein